MNMFPLLKDEVAKYWPILLAGFEEVLTHSNGDEDLTKILQDSLNGHLLIWVVFEEKEFVGFVTTRYVEYPTKYLIWDHAWQSKKFKPFQFTKPVMEKVEQYAKSLGCRQIKTYSLRNVERYYKRYGYNPSYVEYIKEVEQDE